MKYIKTEAKMDLHLKVIYLTFFLIIIYLGYNPETEG